MNVPIGILAFLIGRKSLPESPRSGSLDILGAILNVLMFGLGFIGINAWTQGASDRFGYYLRGRGDDCRGRTRLRSRTETSPIIPLDLLRNREFSLSITTSVASFSAQMLAFVSLPFYFEGILHRDQVATGLLMTPWPVAVGLSAPFAGRLADKFPSAILSGVGLTVLAIGLASLAFLSPSGFGTSDHLAHGAVRPGVRFFSGTQ